MTRSMPALALFTVLSACVAEAGSVDSATIDDGKADGTAACSWEFRDRVFFGDRPVTRDIQARVDTANGRRGSWSLVTVHSSTVLAPRGVTPSFERVLESMVRSEDSPERYCATFGEATRADLEYGALVDGLGSDFVAMLAADAGSTSFRIGDVYGSFDISAETNQTERAFVLVFDNGVVTVLRSTMWIGTELGDG